MPTDNADDARAAAAAAAAADHDIATDDIPHERRAKLSNMVAGKAKEAIGRLTHDDAYIEEGRTQEEIAADDVRPDLDGDPTAAARPDEPPTR